MSKASTQRGYNMSQAGIANTNLVPPPPTVVTDLAPDTGTNPVVPAAGIITVHGATVAAGTHPVRTDGTAASTMAIEVQTSQAIASTDATKIGLSNFNSAQFSVDANGFVSATGTIPITTTEDSGTATPSAGNLNLLGQQAGTIPVMATNGSGSTAKFEDRSWTTPYIVDPSSTVGLRGTFTTIGAALTAASSGQTIYVRPGSYTEDLTLKAGVNIVAYQGSGETPTVTVIGNATASFAGTATLSGLRLQTNSANCITISGSSATILNIENCYINASNNTAISYSSSSASSQLNIFDCQGNIATTGIAMFANSGAGEMLVKDSFWFNSGSSSTANTISAGNVTFFNCILSNPVTSSSTGSIGMFYTNHDTSGVNTTCITCGGSGAHFAYLSFIKSGSASTISISQTMSVYNCIITSTNTNAITGAGTLVYSNLTFVSSSVINATTQTPHYTQLGQYKASGQPCFQAITSGSTITNVTGDGTAYTLVFQTTEYDLNSNFNAGTGTFTAPVTGKYAFQVGCAMLSLGASHTTGSLTIVTTVSTIVNGGNYGAMRDGSNALRINGSLETFMNAGDTCSCVLTVSGSTKSIGIQAAAGAFTFFSGHLIA